MLFLVGNVKESSRREGEPEKLRYDHISGRLRMSCAPKDMMGYARKLKRVMMYTFYMRLCNQLSLAYDATELREESHG